MTSVLRYLRYFLESLAITFAIFGAFMLVVYLLAGCSHAPPKREPEELPPHCRKMLPAGLVFCEMRSEGVRK